MDMLIPTEIDWLNAYYGVFDAWDATFNFWIAATFAVIVAVHAISKTITTNLRWFLLTLYSLFSITMLSRAAVISHESFVIGGKILELGIPLVPKSDNYLWSATFFFDVSLLLLFLVGSIGILVYIWSVGRE